MRNFWFVATPILERVRRFAVQGVFAEDDQIYIRMPLELMVSLN